MKLKTVNGTVVEIFKAEPIVEARVMLNGHQHRLVEVAKDANQNSSGLLFHLKSDSTDGFHTCDVFGNMGALFVGNLKSGIVTNILDSLLTSGYADISKFSYQRKTFDASSYKFNEGESSPYFMEGMLATMDMKPYIPVYPAINSSDEDLEDLRAEVYEKTKEYTMSQLVNMTESELLAILEGYDN